MKKRKYFSVEKANRSLIYIKPIVQEIIETYASINKIRRTMESAIGDVNLLEGEYDATMAKLADLLRELDEVGCELKDFEKGLVDFPTEHQGRKVLLCWRMDEPEVSYWHEEHEGMLGRRPIEGMKEAV